MNPYPHRSPAKAKDQERVEPNREIQKIEDDYYDGQTGCSEYSQAIYDLLKDPVSLGIVGGNSIRGRQR